MKKLNLDIAALVVESFDSLPISAGRGTVVGNSFIEPETAWDGCVAFSDVDPGCAISDNDGTCYVTLCGQPGCGGSADLVEC